MKIEFNYAQKILRNTIGKIFRNRFTYRKHSPHYARLKVRELHIAINQIENAK